MTLGTTVASFIEGFHGADVKVTDADGKAVSGSALLGTGMKATYNGTTFQAALPGDLTGDGKTMITDVMEACKILARKSLNIEPTAVEKIAGDVNGDTSVNITDVMGLCKILAQKA